MKVGFGYLDGLTVTLSEEMEPWSWFAYDRDGRIIQTGIVGFGSLNHHEDAVAVRVTVGRSLWASLRKAVPATDLPRPR